MSAQDDKTRQGKYGKYIREAQDQSDTEALTDALLPRLLLLKTAVYSRPFMVIAIAAPIKIEPHIIMASDVSTHLTNGNVYSSGSGENWCELYRVRNCVTLNKKDEPNCSGCH